MRKLFQLQKYLDYQWRAKTKYYLHSPFVYQFYLEVIEGKNDSVIEQINTLRTKLRNDRTEIALTDLGTGSDLSRTISSLENKTAVAAKYGELLHRLVKHFQPSTILEIGTSLGISSAYIASGNLRSKILTIEGSNELAKLARQNHSLLGFENIQIELGDIDDVLPNCIQKLDTIDFVFFDGNHTYDATLRYFETCLQKHNENSVFVFDDIYWSEEMQNAWNVIRQNPSVTLTLDLYQFGICIFRKEKIAKENFVLRY